MQLEQACNELRAQLVESSMEWNDRKITLETEIKELQQRNSGLLEKVEELEQKHEELEQRPVCGGGGVTGCGVLSCERTRH